MKNNELTKEARRLHRLGWGIHWLHPKSKRPIESGWGSGPRKDWEYLKETYIEGLNLGVRLGTPSKIGQNYLAVVDVDIKSEDPRHRSEAAIAVRGLLGVSTGVCPIVRSGRGNGSRHYYCVTKEPFKTFNPAQSTDIIKVHQPSKKPSKQELKELTENEISNGIRLSHAWEISLYSDGRQVVLPPSIHPDSGKMYTWKDGKSVTLSMELPCLEFKLPPADESQLVEASMLNAKTGHSIPAVENFVFTPIAVDIGWLNVSEAVREAIVSGSGVGDRSGYLLTAATALYSSGLSTNEVLSVLTDPSTYLGACAYEHAQTKNRLKAAQWLWKYTVKRISEERAAVAAFLIGDDPPSRKLTAEEVATQNEEMGEERNWRKELDRTEKGAVKTTLLNVVAILTNDLEQPLFVKDLFANRVMYGAKPKWRGEKSAAIKDSDLIAAKCWLSETWGIEPAVNLILEAVTHISLDNAIHPVKDWLDSLEWDGKSRVGSWLKSYCQAEAKEPYLSEVSAKFLLSMVKRIYEPGCQCDYTLVLEGRQGNFKSSIARAIAGDKWFMDNLPDLKDKDAMLNLQGKWLIELGELTNVKRGDYNLVKAYLTRRIDTVRPHYGRVMEDVPRQSVFIGTVNETQYLKDPTGNRRFWPVSVGMCDVEGLKAVRDQLFAETVHIYKQGEAALWLSPEVEMQAREEQENRGADDEHSEMHDALVEFMNSEEGGEFDFKKFKIKQLFAAHPWAKWSDKNYALQNGAQVLSNLGFKRRKSDGQRVWSLDKKTPQGRPQGIPKIGCALQKDDFY